MASSLGITLIMIFLGFITRRVFVDNVGVEYLGLNGLLQNILGVMTLLEGGFATSVVYNMYKPLAQDDRPKILALLQLYKKVYRWIALGIVIFSLALYPFLDCFMKNAEDLSYVSIVYFIFVFNSVVGYFTAYKWSLINASQQVYKLTVVNLVYQVGLNLTKLAILYYTKNYILYLVVEALFGVGLNIAIVRKADTLFPYIKTKVKYEVERSVKRGIIKNMKALFINNVGGYFMHSTDNIIISSFVGVSIVGLYSNYTLIISTVTTMVSQVLNSFSESIGNLIASEEDDKVYSVFKTIFFVNFIMASVPTLILINTLDPFIQWWLGSDYLLNDATVYVLLLNFYIEVMRSSSITFKVKAGIFQQDRWTPFLQGIINVALSLWFVHEWGITGVFIATTISILSIGFWQFPRLCYRHVFHQPLKKYFLTYAVYTSVAVLSLAISIVVCRLFYFENLFVQAVLNGIFTLLIVTLSYVMAFGKTTPFIQLMVYSRSIISRLR